MIRFVPTLFLIIFSVWPRPAQAQTGDSGALCASATSCGECISASPNCTWCSDETVIASPTGSKSRCRLLSSWTDGALCHNLSDPKSALVIDKNNDVNTEQVAPQSFNVSLRPGEKVKVTVSVRPAENHPVDLYYLMDMSHSMNDDLANLKRLAGVLASELKKKTKNTRVGFGTFVDKTTTPYIDPSSFSNPCGRSSPCASPYSFKNALPLTDDVNEFVSKVNAEQISGNVDFPEGGMDALMQVAVCGMQIGWDSNPNPQARRIAVLATDAGFHFAGDGKLGGAVIPNDGQCHLNSSHQYTAALDQDYPSIGHLNERLKENNILPVFAVQKAYASQYRNLEGQIDALRAAELDADSGNVVQLIIDIYNEIVSTVIPVIPVLPGISIVAKPKCKLGSVQPNPGECQNVQLGETVTFDFEISADSCAAIEANKNLRIRFSGFNDVDIKLSPVCDCGCSSQPEQNVSVCQNGTLRCGQCECMPGKFGERCECNEDNAEIGTGCGPVNASSSDFIPCNGPSNGDCVCGKCQCRDNFVGDQCQCNKQACNRDSAGNICGGSDRGRCDCGTDELVPICVCNAGFTGPACECPTSVEQCKDEPSDAKVCSGQGLCKCGKCQCFDGFIGVTCSTCTKVGCLNFDYCTQYPACMECLGFGTGPLAPGCGANCSAINVTKIPAFGVSDSNPYTINGYAAYPCLGSSGSCRFDFYYALANDGTLQPFHIEDELVCPVTNAVSYLPLILGLVFGILALVLVPLIMWKFVTMYLDNQEYKRFVQEKKTAKYQKSENPLYKNPAQTTTNPAYGKA